jgi:hypothetical protein
MIAVFQKGIIMEQINNSYLFASVFIGNLFTLLQHPLRNGFSFLSHSPIFDRRVILFGISVINCLVCLGFSLFHRNSLSTFYTFVCLFVCFDTGEIAGMTSRRVLLLFIL